MITREESRRVLRQYIENESLRRHCEMVAVAMEACARERQLPDETVEQWWTAGLLHDLDWEKYPDEHPNKAIADIFPEYDIPDAVINAIRAHAPERTGREPEADIERYLFACDEISGFMNAVALMRPNGFADMKVKSVTKKLKDHHFAANVSREDINRGAALIEKPLNDHLSFLIGVFRNFPPA